MADLAVVGAGIVGASVAYHAARLGMAVTLLDERAAPGAGVTGGSFGWIGDSPGAGWPGGAEDLRPSVLADHRRLAAGLPGHTVRWTGSLTWTSWTVDETADETADGGAPGPGRRLVGPRDIAALEPALRRLPARAVLAPGDGAVDPAAMTRLLVAAAGAHGAEVVTGARVTGLRMRAGRVTRVLSRRGFHPASKVVLAAGTGVRRLAAPLGADLPVAESPACSVRIAAPPGLVKTVLSCPGFEVREAGEGELLMTLPCGEDTSDAALARAVRDGLRRLTAAFGPPGPLRPLGAGYHGRPMPARGPLVGPLTPDGRVHVAVVHSAVTLAPTAGRLLAAELADGTAAAQLARCRP